MIRRLVARVLLCSFAWQSTGLGSLAPAVAAPAPARAVEREPLVASTALASDPGVATLLPVSIDLGEARGFGGFFLQTFAATGSHVHGRLAAGSHVTVNNYSIAEKLSPKFPGVSVVVGGDITFPRGRVYEGDIVVAGSAAGIGQSVLDALNPDQTVSEFAELPFDFAEEWARIEQTSQNLSGLTPNGTVQWQNGELLLHGDCQSPSQVFSLNGQQVLDATAFQVDCLPEGATVILNIGGSQAGLRNISLESLAGHQATTLYNFHQAQTLTLTGVTVRGTVLAPHADVVQPQGVLHGTAIARSWNGPMRIKHVPFRGVGEGDFCPLYPIGLPHELLESAAPGQQFLEVPRGTGPGQFSWLTWAGGPSAPTLAKSLTPPGDSYTYVNPYDNTDWLLSPGDWVIGASGNMNSAAVRARLDALIGQEIAVPAWSSNSGQGSNFAYETQGFVRVRLLAYQLTGKGWLSFEYLGVASCSNRPPTVDAGPDQAIALPPGVASLAGSVEDDGLPTGELEILWTKVSGPGPVTFADPQSAATTATFTVAGEYVLRLAASDTELEASDEMRVVVAEDANEAPVVDAGPNHQITLPVDTVTLPGTATDDGLPQGSSLSVLWTQLSGPEPVQFGTPTAAVTTARFSAAGTYVLQLSATDGQLSGTDTTTVIVRPPNQPPAVDAGPDQTLVLPDDEADLAGTVADDGQPSGTLSVAWTQAGGPAGVTFANASSAVTTAHFPGSGTYVLRLTADDGAASASDELTVTVEPPIPVISITGASVTEGHHGAAAATLEVHLSVATERIVSVDFGTVDGTAGACDYSPRAGTLTFAAGEVLKTVVVPVTGDLVVEGNEAFTVRLAQPVQGTLGVDQATVAIIDDDQDNQPPTAPADRQPPDHSVGVVASPTLSWAASDPDPGEALAYDVYFGTAFDTTGQSWSRTCPGGAAPSARRAPASAYDADGDRLLVLGGASGSGAALADLWILDDASGAGRLPSWRARATGAGPSARQSASLVLDPASGRAVLFGGCGDACETAAADAWVLVDPVGTGGPAEWQALPDAPAARAGHAAAYAPQSGRMIVFGGSAAAGGPDSSDVWVLAHATTPASAQWHVLAVGGEVPPARRDAAVAYDAEGDRLFVVGGRTAAGDVLGDAWILEHASGVGGAPEWIALSVAGTGPSPRSGAVLAFDAPSDRLLLTGGASAELGDDPAYAFDDLWILTGLGGAAPTWSLVTPASDRPTGRYQAAAGYSPANARLVLALGGSPQSSGGLDDAWQLESPFGSLPLVSTGQPASTFVAGPLPDDVLHFWRVVARDPKGAFHGSTVFRFTPGTPLIDVASASTAEGHDGTHPMTFALTLSAARDTDIVVSWTTADGSAVAGEDYVSATGTVTFPAGATTATVNVDVVGDHYPESDETLGLVLSNPLGAAIRNGDAVGTIVDDDTPNDPPVVSAGPDQIVPVGPASLDGTVTDDGRPLPPTLSVLWTQVSGPGAASFANATAADTIVTLPAAGIYVLRLTASDGELSTSDDVTIEALAGNAPPVVSAGPDQTVLAPATVATLSGFASDDGLPVGSTLTVAWSLVSGPGTVSFGNAAAVATTVTLTAPGEYVLRLTASDGELSASDEATVTLVLANAPPVVSAGPDQSVFLPVVQASLPGTATDDGVPGPLTTTWTAVSGPPGVVFANASSPATSATFPGAGVYVLRLTASDGDETVSDEATITVAAAPDIVVVSVDASGAVVDGQTLEVSGPVEVELRNASTTATGPFAVTFFEDRNRNGAYEADELLGTASHPGLAGGATDTLTANVEGTLLFVGNLVWAFADSGQVVVESNETNNYGNSAPPCQLPPPGAFSPVREWAWTSTSVMPTYTNVMSTPMAADLDLDGVADVVFASFPGGSYTGLGVLRALRGNNGSELWNATAAGSEVNAVGNVAIGNIDADPYPEIVTFRGAQPIAFEHDGTRKWLGTSGQHPNWGGPSLADLDGDGLVEIVAGRQVFNTDGTIRWTGTGTNGDVGGTGPLSIVADLDMDGSPEVVAGPTAYRANGTIWWRNTSVNDGGTAVGNFDADPFPEVVVTGGGRVWLLEHDGTIKWGPISHPGGGVPGAPTVADFDGDGAPEIGVAGASRYTVFETNGTIRWSAIIQDGSSNRTGSSVFDFEGDGRAEVVYRDETKLWVFRGTDGVVLFSTPLHSCTTYEYPIILDVDGDGNAEIVSPANDTCGFGPTTGIHVFGDSTDRWVGTRPIWNQHTYHITNIGEDLTIPRHEDPSWLIYNSYRQNILTGGCPSAQPDVTASYVRIARQGAQVALTARIGNAGVPVGAVHASFYDGDPRTGGKLLGTGLTSGSLLTGTFRDVTILVSPAESAYPLWVVADDRGGLSGALTESNETNNFYESPFDLVPTPNEPPVVNAGPDQSAVVGTVSLAGQVTDDGLPSDTLVSVWTVVSGAGPVSFANDAQPATTVTFSQVGTHVLRLTASDGDLTGQDEVTITVTPGNQPPSVDAGPDQAATLPSDTVTLQGQVTDDGLPGAPLVVTWSQVSGPATVVFASPSTPVTGATAPVVGTYVLRLTANDGALTVSDDVTVRIGDATSQPDLVVASVDASGLDVDDQTFALTGSAVVTVRNVGLATAGGPFTLTVFEDRDFDGVFDPTDGVLGSAELSDLAPGASPVVNVPLAGTLLFHGNLVHAFVDSGAVVVESDETNNYGNSAPPCPDEPPSSMPFQPFIKWAWTGAGSPVPTANDVESAPVVVDLDLDGLPEVLTNTWPGSSQSYLRALSGRDGSHVFTVQDPARRLYWASHLAVGNLDADPNPEIVAVATSQTQLYAFEHDGTFKWASPTLEVTGYGGPALADLDGDGVSEIVIGKQVLNTNGTLRWTGTGGRTESYAQLSLVADLDMDGSPEVMAGATAYRANGSIYWRLTTIGDGFNAVGNFDADPFPEIVHVAGGQVRLLEHTGAIKWGPVPIPGGGSGGPPTVADFDGDGQAEIGVAGATRYAVFETNGALRWQATTQDGSSHKTGSSVFDFEGDGSAEVVYADEVNLRVYRGSDGAVLFESRMGSSTAVEYPIVADVDADGHAEIVAVGSGEPTGRSGVFVFGDAHDRWVSTRRIWNQHTYHVDNVRNDATIPAHEVASWSTHNTYRQNLQPGGCASALPDLVAGHLRVTEGTSDRLLTARIGNAGNNLTGPLPVAFYDGEPFQGGALLGTTATTVSLAPGQFQDVTLSVPLSTVTNRTVWVVADDRGQGVGNVRESIETNNAYDSRRALTAADGLPDLVPARFDLANAGTDPATLALSGDAQVEVRNQGDVPASAFDVTAFADRNGNGVFDAGVDLVVGTASATGVAAGASTVVDLTLAGTLLFVGEPLFAFVDSGAAVLESNESNNVARAGEVCLYQPAPGPFALRVERSWTASPVNPTSVGVSTTPLVADLDGDARPEIIFSTHVTTGVTSGALRAVHGRDMTPVFTTATAIRASAQMAVGDIDADGRPEIVAVSPGANTLLAFEHDGTLKWTSAVIESVFDGGPSIVNLDGAGLPEIVIGRQVLNANGTIRWTGTGGTGGFGGSRFSAVADLNGDGSPEVVSGNTAYRADGTVLWTASSVSDGFTAIADVDADGQPEVLVTNTNGVWCVEHDGTVKWGPVRFGTAIWGAPPTIADLDGDGAPEALVSIDTHLVVMDGLGTSGYVRWSLPVNQFREAMAAAHDFDGDGAAEVAFTDGAAFRILSGTDGAVLGQLPLGTFTNRQGVVVADVDADGEAEVLTGASAFNGGTTTPGLYVVSESTGAWQPARRIWNESGYHVTNVAEDGTIPAVEPASWLGANVYRAQVGSSAVPLGAPDLSASYPRRVTTPTATEITVRIGNGGSQFAAAGIAVSFYDGDPRENGVLLGTVLTTQDLLPGQYQDVTLSLGPGAYAGRIVWAVADDEGGLVGRHAECDEANNFLETGFALNEAPDVDAGPEQTVVFPDNTATLDGSATDDGVPAGEPLLLRWTRVSGPGLALFANPSSGQTEVTFTSGGVYVLRLTVTDSVLVSSDDVTITVTGPNQAPVVSAGTDAILVHPTDTHVLTGSVTDDGLPLGVSVTSIWTQVSGPAAAVFADPTSPSTAVQLPAVGTYRFRLTASDTQLSAFDDVEVRRLGPNQAPVVSAGADQHVALPVNTATLTGVVTDDGQPLGATLVHSWTVVSGPGPVTFSTPTAASTQATFGAIGTYVLRLTVSDTALSGSDDVTVELLPPNRPPTVDARPDRVIAAGDDLVIEAAVSDDGLPLPPTLTFAWSQVSGPGVAVFSSPASTTTAIQFTQAGVYVLRLSANDGALTGSDDVQITVEAGNLPPVVNAGPDRTLQQPASLLTLNGSVSDDGQPAGSSVSVLWSQVSGPAAVVFTTPTSAVTPAAFSTSGTYVLRLTATDTAATRTDDVTVVVVPVNRAPVVNAGPDQTLAAPPATQIALAGSVTDDGLPVGASVTSVWLQVSGPAAVAIADPTSPVTTASFTALGVYVLRLRASDSVLTAQDDVRVTVADGNQPPTVDAGPDQTIVVPVDTATLTGSATDDGLPAGAGLRYQWSLASGPALPVFADPLVPVTTVRLDAPGTYVLRLVVTDTVHTRSDTTSVTLQAPPPVGPPPVVAITAPADGSPVTEPTTVVGTVDSQALRAWTLERRAAGDTAWTPVANGTTNVSAGTLGTLDPTLLLNGVQELRLSATDLSGRTSRTSSSVVVKDNQKIGQFSVAFVDLEVPVAGLPIRVTRTYDSRDKSLGDFGYGWRLSLSDIKIAEAALLGASWTASTTFGAFPSYCLALSRAAVVTVTMPDGQALEFDPVLNRSCWSFAPPSEVTVSFRARPGTLGTLSVLDGNTAFIASSWPAQGQSQPATLLDVNDFDYIDPELYQLTLPDGRSFVVRQGKGLQSLTDLHGNRLTVSANGIQYQNPGVPGSSTGIAFLRDPLGRIKTITDPLNNVLEYTYDPAGDLVEFEDREDHATTFTYHPSFPHHLLTIVDPLGRTPIRNEYYDDGRLKSHTDAFGKTIEYVHNPSLRQEIVTDRENAVRVMEYDTRGNVVRETDPLGRVVDRTFDTRNNRLSETEPYDPASPPNPIPTTRWTYDAQDNVLSITDPTNARVEHTYNARRQVLTTKDPRGIWTENTYDTAGNLTRVRNGVSVPGGPALNETNQTYDAQGNLKTETVIVNGVAHVNLYEYDGSGNVVTETDANGHMTTYTYDGAGNRRTRTTTRTVCTPTCSTETLVTTYEYDREGRATKTIDADGTFTETVYDEFGRPKDLYDKRQKKTTFEYDLMGRRTRSIFADSTTEEATYDGEGRRLTSKDRAERVTTYEYDEAGRLLKTTFVDETFTENHYNAAGRLDWTRDARGKTSFFEYDLAGRRTRVRVPLAPAVFAETSFTYDLAGNQVSVTDPEGRTTDFAYDALSRRTRSTFPALAPGQPRLFAEMAYDELGRRMSERDAAGKVTRFEHDKLGRLTKVVDAEDKETVYGYDELGSRIRQTDANGHVTRFEYDRLGRQTRRILPGGAAEQTDYDDAGNPESRTDFAGRVTTYGYDDLNRLLSRTYPTPFAAQNVSFSYWPTGRRKSVTDARGTTEYTYDSRDRLHTVTEPDGKVLEYGWDGNGNRTGLTATLPGATPLVLTAAFTYDDANRLDLVTDPAGRVHDHGYDRNGNRTSLAQPNGTLTAYSYDAMNRLKALATTRVADSVVVQSYALELGAAGNRTRIVEADGSVKQYGYDDVYRLTNETVSGLFNYAKTFAYDDVGNRLTQSTTGPDAGPPGTVAYDYDERDRLTLAGTQPHEWDLNGNLTTKSGEATYTWDLENRLVRVDLNNGMVVEHAYDSDGNRVRTTTTPNGGSPGTTHFLVDTSAELSHVVAEIDAAGSLGAYYVRGDDLLAVMRPLVANPTTVAHWQTRFYHADYIGSVRRLTDEAGAATDAYTYTAFGELLGHVGSDPQPYAFAGEPYDPNIGFQYHRARWMDPSSGRFVGMDPFAGHVFDPPTLHRYLYVRGDPASRVDPSGQYEGGLSGALTAVSAQITLIGSRVLAGTITRLGAIRALRALNWTFGILSAAYARFGNLFVQLEHGLERGTGRVDIVLRAAPQVIRRAVIEGKAWSFDAIAQAPGRAAGMLEQLRGQAGNYVLEYGDDLIYAFPELPRTPAGQALMQQAQAILTSAGVQRVTFGVTQLMDEVATLLGI